MGTGVGIYIGRKKVNVCSLVRKKGAFQVKQYFIEPIAGNSPEASAEDAKKEPQKKHLSPEAWAIGQALEKIGMKNSVVQASFSPFHLVTRFFQMPLIPHHEWPGAIRYEAVRFVPYKLDESLFDYYAEAREDGGKGKMLWVAFTIVRKQILKKYLDYLRQGSARVASIEPPFSSVARALSVVEPDIWHKTWGGVIIDSEGSVNITIALGRVVYLSRDFLLSDDQVANEARFYQEIKSSFDFVAERLPDQKIKRMFFAGDGDLVFWSDFLSNVFGKEVSFELASFPTEQDIPKHILGALIIPIGLALRSFRKESPLGTLTLLSATERPLDMRAVRRLIGIVFVVFSAIFLFIRLVFLNSAISNLQRQIAQETKDNVISDRELASKTVPDLEQLKTLLKSEISQFNLIFQKDVSLRTLIIEVGNLLPPSIRLETLLFSADGKDFSSSMNENAASSRAQGKFEIKGLCYMNSPEKEVQEVNTLVKNLSENEVVKKFFVSVVLEEVRRSNYGSKNVTAFQIIMKK